LSSLLSQTLVAFTIEFDNEFEHRVPHRTTRHGPNTASRALPWLVSMVMWLKFLRFVPLEGIPLRDLYRQSGCTRDELKTYLPRLTKWWGYLSLGPNLGAGPADRMVTPTAGGRKALEAWRPLTGVIEKRWQDRFGHETMQDLRGAMQSLIASFEMDLPDSLPILGYQLLSSPGQGDTRSKAGTTTSTLPVLLAKVLLAFVTEFESELKFSLAISANVLRLAGDKGVRVRDLPRLSGVSKEAIAMATGFLEKRGLAVLQPESPGSRVKSLILTAAGRRLEKRCGRLVWEIEERWQACPDREAVVSLRSLLERLAGDAFAEQSPLFLGLQPYPECWRASVPKREVLPHYPMILHRGGYPDGS